MGGFLAGIIVSVQLLDVFMNNAGGAWDNAKKIIEDEPTDIKNNTGKGSERHIAGVVGDMVGGPIQRYGRSVIEPTDQGRQSGGADCSSCCCDL